MFQWAIFVPPVVSDLNGSIYCTTEGTWSSVDFDQNFELTNLYRLDCPEGQTDKSIAGCIR